MIHDTPYVRFWMEEGILFAIYKDNVVIDLKVAKQIVEERLKFTGPQKMKVVVFIEGVATIEKDASDFISSLAGVEGLAAAAIITDTPYAAMIGDFFKSVYHPQIILVETFEDKEGAVRWLKGLPIA